MSKWNKLWIGTIAGLIGPLIGYHIFYLISASHMPLSRFNHFIINDSSTHSAIVSVSLIFNLVFFLGAMKLDWLKAARGIILATFIYAPLVVYFKYG